MEVTVLLGPDYPPARISFLLSDARPAALLTRHPAGSRRSPHPNFDAFFSELCVALLASATLVAAPQEELAPGAALPALADHQRVTHLTLTLRCWRYCPPRTAYRQH